jgi:small Trp-rich protein
LALDTKATRFTFDGAAPGVTMLFVVIGVIVLGLHLAGIGPLGAMVFQESWWIILAPFFLAVIWWAWADTTGWTQRQAMDKVDAKREARRQKAINNLRSGNHARK